MAKIRTTKITALQGVLGDLAAEWMTEEDWKRHAEYVKQLGDDYGKPVEYEVSYIPIPGMDDCTLYSPTISSYKMDIIDFSKI